MEYTANKASTRILVVEDSEVISRMLSALLNYDGYDVVGVAENGMVAMEMYDILRPDVVLMDIAMPVMGGIETLRELKDEYGPDVRVVMVSGVIDPDTISMCTDLGAEAFIPKPFSINQVREVLERILSHDKVMMANASRRSEEQCWGIEEDRRADPD